MRRQTLHLVERQTREVQLPPAEVVFLLTQARHVIEVAPALRRGFYRLTPRGFAGWFDTPHHRFAVAPKLSWPNLRVLLGLPRAEHRGDCPVEPGLELLNVLAGELADRLAEVTRAGLIAGYHDQDSAGAFLRGKLRPADQLRDAAARAFPDRFHVSESVLDLDTPWNRIPRATADQLLAHPGLAAAVSSKLRDAATALASIPAGPLSNADFTAAEAEPRAAHYRPLLKVCRLIHDGLTAAEFTSIGGKAFLLDLSRAFECYLGTALATAVADLPGWSIEWQPRFVVGQSELRPDIVLDQHGQARVVLDAKWKSLRTGPDTADLHQVLAYASLTRARHVGLVYPGRRLGRRRMALSGDGVQLSLFRVPVLGVNSSDWVARLTRHLIRLSCRV